MIHVPKFFHRKFAQPIEPTGGPGASIVTLEDAAQFMGKMRRWRQARPHWDYAAELVLKAAISGRRADVHAAEAQMRRALVVEGWLSWD